MSAECVCCTKPMPDQAYACQRCGHDQPKAYLAEIADMLPAARDIAQRQSVHGDGAASGKPGSSLPLSLTDTAKLDTVRDKLTDWCRQIAAERGIAPPWVTTYGDPITAATGWLSGQADWIRHCGPTTNPHWLKLFDPDRPAIVVTQFLDDLRAAHRIIRGIARGPADHRYLGPCGATVTWDDDDVEIPRDSPCGGDVYAPDGRDTGTCRECGARWQSERRREWLDGKVREHNYRASEIAAAYDGLKANTIRKWAERGHIIAHGHDGEGRPLFNLGEVLDWAAADTGRRETERAKRARRAAARTAESENAA